MIEIEGLCVLYLEILNFVLLTMLQVVYIILIISVQALVSLCSHGNAWETIVCI